MKEYKRVALFIGRFSPFHIGHKYIIDTAVDQGKRVCIGIRNTPLSESDPYSYEERVDMIRAVYGSKVEVMLFPDIESINIGRGVGYTINTVDAPTDIKGISATEIREKIKEGDDSWKLCVPDAVAEWIEEND